MKLSDLGFKSFPQEFDWALPNGNVRVEQSYKYKGFWSLELDKNFKSDRYNHLLYVDRIPKASLMNFLENNIDGLKEFDGKPNKTFVNKVKKEVLSLSKPLRFKNMWIHYNFRMPSNATKGILYDIDFVINKDKDSRTLPSKVDKILSSLKKTPFSDMLSSSSVSDASCFLYNKTKQEKKQALEIPYISKIDKRLKKEDDDYGYYGAVLMSNTYKGKFKGVGTNATIYYFVLIMGGDTEDDIGDPAVCVEVITPIDKGEDFFLKEVKNAVAKFNPLKFTGKKIYVNKCPKTVTGSTEMKTYSYKGQFITASSKQEAIQKIVAGKNFKPGTKVGVSLKILYDSTKKHKTDFGYTIDTSEEGYYDLRDKFGDIVCMDGEVCKVKTVSKLGDIIFTNNNGEKETSFTLSKKEVDTCVG